MREIRRFAGETLPVLRVLLVGAPPKIGGIGDERVGALDHRQGFVRRADQVRRAPGGGGVLQGVAGLPLGGIHPDCQRVARHLRADHPDSSDHRLGTGFAGELPVGGLRVGHNPQGFRHNRGGRLDRVGVRFRANPHRPDFGGVNLRPPQRVARRLDGHGRHVLVEPGHRFFLDGRPAHAIGPDT